LLVRNHRPFRSVRQFSLVVVGGVFCGVGWAPDVGSTPVRVSVRVITNPLDWLRSAATFST
jgi:hypothetical protein